jgi:hypothetical protein
MQRFKFFVIFISLFPIFLSAADWRAKLEITGGPVASLSIYEPFAKNWEFNAGVGGFPNIIFRLDANIKYKTEKKWFPFHQFGMSNMHFFRGQMNRKKLYMFQLNSAIYSYDFMSIDWMPYFGLIFVPKFMNKYPKDLDDTGIVPMLGVEIYYNGG